MTGLNPTGRAWKPRDLLGVVLAGGEARRFGSDKALTEVGGRPMAAWAIEALKPWTSAQVIITNSPPVAEALGVPSRPDTILGQGPIGGLHAALAWAREDGREGVFVLACDLPLVPPKLVGRILELWPTGAAAVVPGSHGPRGFEPLCAGYSLEGLPVVHQLIQDGRRAMDEALALLEVHRIPAELLGSPESLSLAFTNVNTPDTARSAHDLLLGGSPSARGILGPDGECL